MTTKVEIVNIALSIIGANLITSLDDDSEEAKLAKLHYDIARDATLEVQEWTFAVKRFNPAQDKETPLFGWGFQFTVPSEIIRVLSCDRIDADTQPPNDVLDVNYVSEFEQIDWILEDGKILCNVELVNARGLRRVTETGKFSALFVHAFAAKLAILLAIPLTQSNTIFDKAVALYGAMISEAKSRDGIQGRSRRIRNKTYLRVR